MINLVECHLFGRKNDQSHERGSMKWGDSCTHGVGKTYMTGLLQSVGTRKTQSMYPRFVRSDADLSMRCIVEQLLAVPWFE